MADLTKNLIFRVGSEMGPGGLASLKAGYDMTMQIASGVVQLAGAIKDQIDKTQEWLDVQRNVTIDMSKVDHAVRGLTGTMNLMTSANRLTQAGVKVSAEQFAAITKNAAAFADATGIDTAQALDQLVSGLITGNERGLRPFGLSLKDGTDKTEKQADAIKQLTERADGLTVGLDTLAEKTGAVADQWDRFKAIVMDGNEIVAEQNTLIQALSLTFGELTESIDTGLAAWEKLLNKIKTRKSEIEEVARLIKELAIARNIAGGGEIPLGYVPPKPSNLISIEEPFQITGKKPGGGGGGGLEPPDPVQARILMAPTPEEIITTMEASEAANQRYMEMMQVEVDNKLELINIEDEAKRISSENALSYVAYEVDSSISYYRLGAQQRMDILSQAFASGANMMQLSQQLQYQLDADDEKHARKKHQTMKHLWQVGKVATLGQIQIDAARAIMGTWASLSGLGIPGIILAGVMTGFIAITAGLQSAIVAKQSFEGGTNSGGGGTSITAGSLGGGGVGGEAVNYGSGSSSYNQPGASQEQKISITINMGDNAMFLDAVVDANDSASMSGRRHFARVR